VRTIGERPATTTYAEDGLLALNEGAQANAQDARQLSQCQERDVELAAFQPAHVAPVHVSLVGEVFLRHTLRPPSFLKTRADPLQ
jgi:hypothetical protein